MSGTTPYSAKCQKYFAQKWEHVLAVRDELKNKVDAGVITNYHFITALRNTGQVDKIIGEYEDFVNAGGKVTKWLWVV